MGGWLEEAGGIWQEQTQQCKVQHALTQACQPTLALTTPMFWNVKSQRLAFARRVTVELCGPQFTFLS